MSHKPFSVRLKEMKPEYSANDETEFQISVVKKDDNDREVKLKLKNKKYIYIHIFIVVFLLLFIMFRLKKITILN